MTLLWPFLLALGLQLGGGLVALLLMRWNRAALVAGTASCVAASIVGVAAAGRLLLIGGGATVQAAWRVPVGTLRVGVDPLSAFFLLCVYLVTGLSVVYGAGYLPRDGSRRLAAPVFFFSLLAASMAGVALARDGVLFLVAWEIMSLAGFFLVTFDDEREEVRRAGMVYLIASHVGVVCLFVLFTLLAREGGTFSFAAILHAGTPPRALADACFVLALVGFGAKAGFWILHTWLPEAHPAAPSHVSATMSGVMIEMGIYGVLRILTLLGAPPSWWGIVVIAIGAVSALLGMLHALAQRDLKRLLAYSSIENVGVMSLGIGLGLLGQSTGHARIAFLGYAGAILHVLNHGLFKGILFQGAGSVLHATGTKEMDALGGLSRRMPVTALTFSIAAIAICGLPPLNGFVSEWLIYVAAFHGGALHGAGIVAALAVIPILALVGGLAAACFVKAYGVVFLGQPRTEAGAAAHEAPAAMRIPMIAGAVCCVAIGLRPDVAFRLVARPAGTLAGVADAGWAVGALVPIVRVAAVLLAVVCVLALLRHALLRRREVAVGPVWGCGYAAPAARMQYTASSFAEPLLAPFQPLVPRTVHEEPPRGYFPGAAERAARFEEHAGDLVGIRVIAPVARRARGVLARLRVVQQGRVQMYLLYILVTVVAVLVWQLGGGAR